MRGTKPSFLHFLIVHWCPSRMPFHIHLRSGSNHCDRLARGGEKASGKSSDNPLLSRDAAEKRGNTLPSRGEFRSTMHRLRANWGTAGPRHLAATRIPVRRHDVVDLFATHGFRGKALITAKQIGNEQSSAPDLARNAWAEPGSTRYPV